MKDKALTKKERALDAARKWTTNANKTSKTVLIRIDLQAYEMLCDRAKIANKKPSALASRLLEKEIYNAT